MLDEAHRLRNVYKNGNIIARTLKNAMAHVQSKVLLTATPLQNSLLELYGLVSIIDGRVFGDLDSFRAQFTGRANFDALRKRLAPVCKRTLRQQVQPYVSYTARRAIVQEFTPSDEERELSRLVADYLRRPDLKALPEGQRQLISLVLWKLLASSSRAIAGALATMAERLQNLLNSGNSEALAQSLDEDYEGLSRHRRRMGRRRRRSPSRQQRTRCHCRRNRRTSAGEKTITYRKINALSTNKGYIVGRYYKRFLRSNSSSRR